MNSESDSRFRTCHAIDWRQVLGSRYAGLDHIQVQQLSQSLASHSPRSLRLNCFKNFSQLPFEVTQVPWYRDGRWVTDPSVRPGAYLHYAAGDYYIQDAASMLALQACRVHADESVCDVCAAPGGKSTGLLQQLNHTGYLVANEVIKSRLPVLNRSLERTGLGNYVTTSLDVARLAELLPEHFDCVLVDAPCTGQSMIASHRQSLNSFSEHQINHSAARQQRILQAASNLARPSGRLVYSTCTFSIAENEQIIDRFLSLNPDWRPVCYPDLTQWESPVQPGCYRLWPHRDGCDGAFVATLARTEHKADSWDDPSNVSDSAFSSSRQNMSPKNRFGTERLVPWRGKTTQLSFLDSSRIEVAGYSFWQADHRLLLLNDQFPVQLRQHVVSAPTVASLRNGRIEPDYSSAVLLLPELQPAANIELSSQQALRYVSGESIRLDQPQPFQGWCRVEWSGRQLGWGKVLENQLKNHLPKTLRQHNLVVQ